MKEEGLSSLLGVAGAGEFDLMKLQREVLNKTTAQAFTYNNTGGSYCNSNPIKCLLNWG